MKTRPLGILALIMVVAAVAGMTAAFVAGRGYGEDVVYYGSAFGRIILFAAVGWAAYFAGRLICRLGFRWRDPWWEVELGIGYAAFGMTALFLGACHILYPWVIRGITLAVLVISAPTLARLLEEGGNRLRQSWRGISLSTALVALGACTLILVFSVRAFLPPHDWDVLVYHLYIPKAYLAAHSLVYMPYLVYASMPLGAEMMFTWGYGWEGLGSANGVAVLLNCLLLVATWRLARRYLDGFWSLAGVIFLVATPSFAYHFPTANVDLILAFFAISALNLYLRGWERPRDAALTGVLVGAAMGVKYVGLYVLIAVAALFAFDIFRKRWKIAHGIAFFIAAAVVVAPWLLKGFIERGNPVFPALYGVFGGRDLAPAIAAGFARWQSSIGMGREPLDYLLLPYRIAVEAGPGYACFDGQLLPWITLTAALAIAFFRKSRVLIFTAVYFLCWAFIGSQQLRFLAVCFAPLAVLSAGVFAAATDWTSGWKRIWLRIFLWMVIGLGVVVVDLPTIRYCLEGIIYIGPKRSEAALMHYAPCYQFHKYINATVPRGARVLMLFDNHLLYNEADAVYDSFFEASSVIMPTENFNTTKELADYINKLGIRYIFLSSGGARYFWGNYDGTTRLLWERYMEDYTLVVADAGDYQLLEVQSP